MMIRYGLGLTLTLIIGLAIIFLFVQLWKKRKKKMVAGGTVGFFVAVIICAALMIIPSRVYVIYGDNDYNHYLVFGEPTYEMSSGSKVEINNSGNSSILINDSDEGMVLREVIYGFGFGSGDILVDPKSYIVVKSRTIDYFFDDEPPGTIETEQTGAVIRLWVTSEADYGYFEDIDTDDLQDLKDLFEDDEEEEIEDGDDSEDSEEE